MSEKMWGDEPFWGLGYEWDPDWVLTDRQKELRATLIELCEKEMRANAKRSDDELLFPRRNLELLGEHGFLALTVPEEQIYIRLEDMIVITESGATILSDFVPRSIAAVEKTIAAPGLLQQYGRIR